MNEFLSIPNNKLHVSKSNPNLNNDAILGLLKQQSQQEQSSPPPPPMPVQNQSSINSDEFRIKTTFYQAAKTSNKTKKLVYLKNYNILKLVYDQLQLIHQQINKNKDRLIELSNNSNVIF